MQILMDTKNVKRTFGRGSSAVHALHSVTMQVPKGRLLVLKGRSGSGKTTLLNLLGGLDKPTEGEIFFESSEIGRLSDKARTEMRRKSIGFIFQSFGLIPPVQVKRLNW